MLACLLLACTQVAAIEPFQEYRKRVETSQNIAALKDGLFGDSVNLYNGQTSFTHVDIEIPGNNSLPVQLSRKFTVQIMPQGGSGSSPWDTNLGGAGGWDIDVPYVSGTFGPVSGWRSTRCSSNWVPTVTGGFQLTEIWQGNSIHVPGGGDRTMLGVEADTPVPADGAQHRITTSERDAFSCTPMKSGLAGEGFVMKTTSGVKYYFDVAVQRFAGRMTRAVDSSILASTSRVRVYLLASKVEDRFGNTVEYEYNANGNPTRIWSSDGREIGLTYVNGHLAAASAAGRTWTYQYTTVEGQVRLSAAVLPDESQWRFSYSNSLRPFEQSWDGNSDPRCAVQPPELSANFTLAVVHPSNATGTFSFSNTRHYRSGVHISECLARKGPPGGEEISNYWILNTPFYFDVMSLRGKSITGPGIATHAWTYDYGITLQQLWGNRDDGAANYPCASCSSEKHVSVSGPDGVRSRYRYGFKYALNEGRVLGVDTIDAAGNIERSETTEYLGEAEAQGQNFHVRFGAIMNGDDPSTARVRPVVRKSIVQDGVSFNLHVDQGCGGISVYCFDALARPARELKSSSLGSKRDETEYYDDAFRWVLGQVARTRTNGIETSRTEYQSSTALPVRVYEFSRLKQAFTYNGDGTFATLSDGRDGPGMETTIRMSGWRRGTPQLITYPSTPEAAAGSSLSTKVNDDGSLAWIVDENGSKTCYEYDGAGRLSGIVYPADVANVCGGPRARTTLDFAPVASSEYGIPANHWKRTVITGGATQVSYYDAFWRPVVEEQFDSADAARTRSVVVKKYDMGGMLAFQSYPVADITGYSDPTLKGTYTSYDAIDRVVRVEQDSELGTRLVTSTEYLDGFIQKVTNPRSKATTTSFRAYDQPSTNLVRLIVHPEGARTQIERDSVDSPTLLRRRNADSSVTLDRRFVYHPSHHTLCKTIEPETRATVMDYDPAGNLLWSAAGLEFMDATRCNLAEAAGSGRRAIRSYDARNKLTSLSFPDGRGNVAYTYEANGTPKGLVAHNDGVNANVVSTKYEHDRRGLLRNERMQFGSGISWTIDYAYNANGHLASQTYDGLTINYAPNALGQATRAGAYASNAQYFPNGALKQFNYGNGIVHTMLQNARGLPERSTDQHGAVKVLDDSYDYDGNGNVAAITDGATGTSQRGNRTMTYDGLDRLRKAQSIMFGSNAASAASYSYDVLDNLSRVTVNSTATVPGRNWDYFYDANWRLTNVLAHLDGATVVALDYDEQGNMVQKSTSGAENLGFDFDYGNRLRRITRNTSIATQTVSSYLYDGLGRRIRDNNTGVTGGSPGSRYSQYSKDGQILRALDNRTGTAFDYVYLAGSLVAIRERTGESEGYKYKTKYQHTDALGSPVAVTDAGRGVVERNEYEPYGKVLRPMTLKDGPGFTGHVSDAATGLNYMQQRYYDPTIGRFLSVDPVTANGNTGGNFNRYWYANSNPYKFTDPDGRFGRPKDPPYMHVYHVETTMEGGSTKVERLVGTDGAPAPKTNRGSVVMLSQRSADGAPAKSGAAVKERLLNFSEKVGKTVEVTSGQRTTAQNAAVGGAPASQHLKDNAADIRIGGFSKTETADAAHASGEFNRVNEYPGARGVHVDLKAEGNQGRFYNWRPRGDE